MVWCNLGVVWCNLVWYGMVLYRVVLSIYSVSLHRITSPRDPAWPIWYEVPWWSNVTADCKSDGRSKSRCIAPEHLTITRLLYRVFFVFVHRNWWRTTKMYWQVWETLLINKNKVWNLFVDWKVSSSLSLWWYIDIQFYMEVSGRWCVPFFNHL
jgi:hypothetical protein